MTTQVLIRDYEPPADHPGLRQCVVERQDHEHQIDARMPPGNDIADAYISEVLERCDKCAGRILADLEKELK